MKSIRLAGLFLILALLSSCASSIDQQYLAVAKDGINRNYYRITIEGRTRFSSSEFQVGTVPNEFVDRLLGEGRTIIFGEEKDKTETPVVANTIDPSTGESTKGQKVVIVLSSDPGVIFDEVKAMSDSKLISQTLGNILLNAERADKKEAESQLLVLSNQSAVMANSLDGYRRVLKNKVGLINTNTAGKQAEKDVESQLLRLRGFLDE